MRVLLLDNYPLITEMITMIIHKAQPLTKVLAIHSFQQLLKLIEKSEEINVIVIEPKSPGCFGFSSINHIAQCRPNAQIVIMTDVDFGDKVSASEKYKSYHFINKSADINLIFSQFKKIFHPLSPDLNPKKAQEPIAKISKRQMQLLNFLNKGYSNKQISMELGLTEGTVKVHFFHLFKIINVNSRLEALRYAKLNSLIYE